MVKSRGLITSFSHRLILTWLSINCVTLSFHYLKTNEPQFPTLCHKSLSHHTTVKIKCNLSEKPINSNFKHVQTAL